MPFWTYMLHCADRSFYVGHTEDLEQRVWQHQEGLSPHTRSRRPVALVWSENFADREDARALELRLKGWSRLKKLALIRGDWTAISALARGKSKGASTSSASRAWRAERLLHPHLDLPPSQPFSLNTKLRVSERSVSVLFRLDGPLEVILVPPAAAGERRDGLWRHSCFEMFVATSGSSYLEFNFSPSTNWAAYDFEAYRSGLTNPSLEAPAMRVDRKKRSLELSAKLTLPQTITPTRIALSAVIEEKSAHKSYWALAHPPGPPDFHHPDCFALELPPPASE